MRHLGNKKLEDLQLNDLFPGLVLAEREHNQGKIVITRTKKKSLVCTEIPHFESYKLTASKFKELQAQQRWYVVGGCVTDFVTGSLGGSPLYIVRGDMLLVGPTYDVTSLLDRTDVRNGDKIVEYYGSTDKAQRGEYDESEAVLLYASTGDQWITAKELHRARENYL